MKLRIGKSEVLAKLLDDGAYRLYLVDPLQVYYRSNVDARMKVHPNPVTKARANPPVCLLTDKERLFSIVDEQYYNFRPRFEVYKYANFRKARVVTPYPFAKYVPVTFPGFLLGERDGKQYAYIANLKYYEDTSTLVLKYAPLGRIKDLKVIRDKYGYPVKVKLTLSQGKKVSLIRGGRPRKYPELMETLLQKQDFTTNLKYNERMFQRLSRQLKDSLSVNNKDIKKAYYCILRVARTLLKDDKTVERPFEYLPEWTVVSVLPPRDVIEKYSGLDYEDFKYALLVHAAVSLRARYITTERETRPGILNKALGIPFNELPFTNYGTNYFKEGRFFKLAATALLNSRELQDFTSAEAQLNELCKKDLWSLYQEPTSTSIYGTLLGDSKQVRDALRTIMNFESTISSYEEMELIRSFFRFVNVRILAFDAYLVRDNIFKLLLHLKRKPGHLFVTSKDTQGDSRYTRTKRIVRGLINYPAPTEYVLEVSFFFNRQTIKAISMNLTYVDRRPSIKRGIKLVEKSKYPLYLYRLHKHFPFSMYFNVDRNGLLRTSPIRPELSYYLRTSEDESRYRLIKYFLGLRNLSEVCVCDVCLGTLSRVDLEYTAKRLDRVELLAIDLDNYFSNVCLDNSTGYVAPLQIRYPLKPSI